MGVKMPRKILSNRQWNRISPLLPGRPGTVGRPPVDDNRNTVEAMLWIARTGAPWRDLPESFGKWNTIYQRLRRWVKKGIIQRLFAAISQQLQTHTVMVDGSFIKVHQHGTGARKEAAHRMNPSSSKP